MIILKNNSKLSGIRSLDGKEHKIVAKSFFSLFGIVIRYVYIYLIRTETQEKTHTFLLCNIIFFIQLFIFN